MESEEPKNLRVLIVEDSENDTRLLLAELRRKGYAPASMRVETGVEMERALTGNAWDIIISDYILPAFSAPAALELVGRLETDLPFIIVSGKIGEETAVAAFKAGAHDFIEKGNLARLVPAIERELRDAGVRRERQKAEEMLKKLSRAVEQSADAVVITDRDGRIEYVNMGFERTTGYARWEVIGRTPSMLKSGMHDPEFYHEFWRTIGAGSPFRTEFINRNKKGELYYQEETITPVLDDKGNLTHFVSTGKDVTKRKQYEERLESQLRRMAALHSIDRAITTSLDLRLTLKVILAQATSHLRADAASVLLLNTSDQMLRYAAGRGFASQAATRTCLALGEGCPGMAAQNRKLVAFPDTSTCEGSGSSCRTTEMSGEGFRAYFAAPLIAKGEVKGVLEIFNKNPFTPDKEWLQFLRNLADQTAIAVDNATMFGDLQRSNAELVQAYETTLEGWSRALDMRDQETEGHTRRVTDIAVRLGAYMGLDNEALVHLRRGALLHDIGKMGIPDSVLLKPGRLDEQEWEIMRRHPVYAYELLSPIPFLHRALEVPYCHHEKWNGTGYPRGLKGVEIPISARVFAVVDVWDALSSDRPYRKGWEPERVRDYIRAESGEHFDPDVTRAFVELEL